MALDGQHWPCIARGFLQGPAYLAHISVGHSPLYRVAEEAAGRTNNEWAKVMNDMWYDGTNNMVTVSTTRWSVVGGIWIALAWDWGVYVLYLMGYWPCPISRAD